MLQQLQHLREESYEKKRHITEIQQIIQQLENISVETLSEEEKVKKASEVERCTNLLKQSQEREVQLQEQIHLLSKRLEEHQKPSS